MSSDALRMVFLGCGNVTALHSKTLRALRAPVQCAYASRNGVRAAEFNTRFGGFASYGSYDDALAVRDIDVVFIATPPALHLPLTVQALEQGKHVIVEKPAYLSVAELDQVAELARRVDRQVLVAENYYYRRLTTELRRIITSGALGDVLFVSVNALKTQRTGDWRDEAALGGGDALFEGGIHWISLLGNIGLTIRDVHAVRQARTSTACSPRPQRTGATTSRTPANFSKSNRVCAGCRSRVSPASAPG
jgi:predicted dehydrogenase